VEYLGPREGGEAGPCRWPILIDLYGRTIQGRLHEVPWYLAMRIQLILIVYDQKHVIKGNVLDI
jgi:hypothetical protein